MSLLIYPFIFVCVLKSCWITSNKVYVLQNIYKQYKCVLVLPLAYLRGGDVANRSALPLPGKQIVSFSLTELGLHV